MLRTDPADVRLLLFVGLPGSGKSTLADRLTGWTRVCQDEEGSRDACEKRFAEAAARGGEGARIVLDRCNISVDQRRVWLDLARRHGWTTHCVVFDWSIDLCIQRCVQRPDHPTIPQHDLDKATSIVWTMVNSMHAPRIQEGIDVIHVVSSFEDMDKIVALYVKK